MAAKEKLAWIVVAPFSVGRETWEVVPTLFEKCLPRDGVESVLEIDLEKNGIGATSTPSAPLAGHMQAHLGAARLGDADLEWLQMGTCLLLEAGAEELCSEAAPSLTDSHRADGAVVFW